MKNFVYGIVGILVVLLVTNMIITIAKGNVLEKDLLKHDDVEYIAYIYSENCGHCKEIEDDIDDFDENGSIPIYKYNVSQYSSNDRKDLGITGTPMMFHVKNGKFVKTYSGTERCIELMREFR